MSAEEELKAFEAELASLRPRSDRLDRDRLMYWAGRASVGGKCVGGRKRAWFWPAATTAMTSAAAVLLALFVASPRVEVVEQIVEVPAGQPDNRVLTPDGAQPPGNIEQQPGIERRREPLSGRLGAALAGWLAVPDWAALPSTDSYPGLRDAVLAHGLDSLPSPPASANGGRKSEATPASYRDLRDDLLEVRPAGKPSTRPTRGISFLSGAHS